MSVAGPRLDTLAIHAGQEPDPISGAVMTPIVLASTFAQDGPGVMKGPYDYSRAGNPTRTALEQCLAALEGATHGVAFGSGCAATTALLLTLKAGDHVLVGDDVYGGTFRIFDMVMKQWGLEASFMDMSDPVSLAELPAIMPHASLTPEARQALGIGDGLIRLSVGLEDVEDLKEDLERGFRASEAAL